MNSPFLHLHSSSKSISRVWLARWFLLKLLLSSLPAPPRVPPLVFSWVLSPTLLLPPFPLLPLKLILVYKPWLLSSKPRFVLFFISFNGIPINLFFYSLLVNLFSSSLIRFCFSAKGVFIFYALMLHLFARELKEKRRDKWNPIIYHFHRFSGHSLLGMWPIVNLRGETQLGS